RAASSSFVAWGRSPRSPEVSSGWLVRLTHAATKPPQMITMNRTIMTIALPDMVLHLPVTVDIGIRRRRGGRRTGGAAGGRGRPSGGDPAAVGKRIAARLPAGADGDAEVRAGGTGQGVRA